MFYSRHYNQYIHIYHYYLQKLSLVIVIDNKGLEVTQVVTDESSRILLEPTETQLWHFITVTDGKGE